MKKTPKNWKSLTVIDACSQGYHFAHYGRQNEQQYLEHISAQEIIERTLRANPARIYIQLMPETLVFLQPLSTPQFKDRISIYGRYVGPEDATKIHPSCGGLRPLGLHDTIVAAAWNQLLEELSESILATTLSRHPAWAYLTFPFGHSVRDVTTLLVSEIDPRLHVRPDRPDAISPLRNFLGATRRQSKRSKAKLETLCRAWGKGRVDRKDFGRPDAFFSRHHWKLRDGGEPEHRCIESPRSDMSRYSHIIGMVPRGHGLRHHAMYFLHGVFESSDAMHVDDGMVELAEIVDRTPRRLRHHALNSSLRGRRVHLKSCLLRPGISSPPSS